MWKFMLNQIIKYENRIKIFLNMHELKIYEYAQTISGSSQAKFQKNMLSNYTKNEEHGGNRNRESNTSTKLRGIPK